MPAEPRTGREVDQHAGPARCRDLDGPQDDLGRDLHLGDEYLGLSDGLGGIVYVLRGEAAVRARCDRDRVLPIGVTVMKAAPVDEPGTSRTSPVSTPLSASDRTRGPPNPSSPTRPRNATLAPSRAAAGLVGPLATVVGRETSVRDRLAGRGAALHAQDEVLVYRTSDEDVSHSEFLLSRRLAKSTRIAPGLRDDGRN